MDGIAGVFYPNLFEAQNLIYPMLETMSYGAKMSPDVYAYKNIQIASCKKTLTSNNRKSIIVNIDGTIDKTDEVQRELNVKGYHFNDDNPAEVALNMYQIFGIKFLEKISGDFSILILDKNQRSLFLCQDRIGKKPIFWYENRHYFLFASELKALIATGVVPQTPSLEAIASYLYFGYIPQDLSAISDVNKLLPAHYMQVHFDGTKSIHSYWSYSSYFQQKSEMSSAQISAHIDNLIAKQIKHSLLPKGDLGLFLSGGEGSAQIGHLLKEHGGNKKIWAFTASAMGKNSSSMQTIGSVTESLNLNHEIFPLTVDSVLENLVQMIWYLDEPIADPEALITWKLSKMAASYTDVIFTGLGCEELLAGHKKYLKEESFAHQIKNRTEAATSYLMRALISPLKRLHRPTAIALLKKMRAHPWQFEYLSFSAIFDEDEMEIAAPKIKDFFDLQTFLNRFYHIDRIDSELSSYLYFDLKTELADNKVLLFERLTAAHGLQWKAPFLSRELIEFIATVPDSFFDQGNGHIDYLNRKLQEFLSPSITEKLPINEPSFLTLFAGSDELTHVFRHLLKGSLVQSNIISEQWLKNEIDHLSSKNKIPLHLWSILQLEIWFRLYINQPISKTPPKFTVEELLTQLL